MSTSNASLESGYRQQLRAVKDRLLRGLDRHTHPDQRLYGDATVSIMGENRGEGVIELGGVESDGLPRDTRIADVYVEFYPSRTRITGVEPAPGLYEDLGGDGAGVKTAISHILERLSEEDALVYDLDPV